MSLFFYIYIYPPGLCQGFYLNTFYHNVLMKLLKFSGFIFIFFPLTYYCKPATVAQRVSARRHKGDMSESHLHTAS